MLKVKIEKAGYARSSEIKEFYETGDGKTRSIEQVYKEMVEWFKDAPAYNVGHGAHHVWVHDASDERILIVKE